MPVNSLAQLKVCVVVIAHALPCAVHAMSSELQIALHSVSNDFRFEPANTDLSHAIVLQDASDDASALTADESTLDSAATSPAGDNPYFVRGSWRWQLHFAGATEFDDHFALTGVAASCFLDDAFTIDFELNGLYFLQDEGDNTAGINIAMLLRWHALIDDAKRWSFYFDAGFGVMYTADNVPAGGESFNFTPQAGAGFSYLVDQETDTRLLAGIRWHHTSNANTLEDNPGANKLMIYAGLNFPF